jgi:hypothetical protein
LKKQNRIVICPLHEGSHLKKLSITFFYAQQVPAVKLKLEKRLHSVGSLEDVLARACPLLKAEQGHALQHTYRVTDETTTYGYLVL